MPVLMLRAAAGAILFFACSAVFAQQAPTALVLDDSVNQVTGARWRLGFERLPQPGEKAVWTDPDGKLDNTATALLLGGGLIGAGIGDAQAQAERNATIQPLRTAAAANARLRRALEDSMRRMAQEHGYDAHRTIIVHALTPGAIPRVLTGSKDAMAIAVQKAGSSNVVALSWDDRQVLLSLDFRVFRKREGSSGVTALQKQRRIVRYVGHEAPDGTQPLDYWAAGDAAAFMAEIDAGLQRLLPLAFDDALEIPKVPRREMVTLTVAGTSRTFEGRLWKEEAGAAYLFQDGGITVVATDAPSTTTSATVHATFEDHSL